MFILQVDRMKYF